MIKLMIVRDFSLAPKAVAGRDAVVYNATGGCEFFCRSDAVAKDVEHQLKKVGTTLHLTPTRKTVTCPKPVDELLANGYLDATNGFSMEDQRQK